MVSCSSYGLPMHAPLLRLFVTPSVRELYDVFVKASCRHVPDVRQLLQGSCSTRVIQPFIWTRLNHHGMHNTS